MDSSEEINGNISCSETMCRLIENILEESQFTGDLNLAGKLHGDILKTFLYYDLADVSSIDLSKNDILEIPSFVFKFSSLENLNLYHNFLRTIPAKIMQLFNLIQVNLSRNFLYCFPTSLCQLPNLEVLNLSSNKISSIPAEILQLTNLKHLDMSSNMIKELPKEMQHLKNLRSLNLRRNLISNLNLCLINLKLSFLDLSNNKLTNLSFEHYRIFSFVNFLNLQHNPMINPPPSVLLKGKMHIVKYLQTQCYKSRLNLTPDKINSVPLVLNESIQSKSISSLNYPKNTKLCYSESKSHNNFSQIKKRLNNLDEFQNNIDSNEFDSNMITSKGVKKNHSFNLNTSSSIFSSHSNSNINNEQNLYTHVNGNLNTSFDKILPSNDQLDLDCINDINSKDIFCDITNHVDYLDNNFNKNKSSIIDKEYININNECTNNLSTLKKEKIRKNSKTSPHSKKPLKQSPKAVIKNKYENINIPKDILSSEDNFNSFTNLVTLEKDIFNDDALFTEDSNCLNHENVLKKYNSKIVNKNINETEINCANQSLIDIGFIVNVDTYLQNDQGNTSLKNVRNYQNSHDNIKLKCDKFENLNENYLKNGLQDFPENYTKENFDEEINFNKNIDDSNHIQSRDFNTNSNLSEDSNIKNSINALSENYHSYNSLHQRPSFLKFEKVVNKKLEQSNKNKNEDFKEVFYDLNKKRTLEANIIKQKLKEEKNLLLKQNIPLKQRFLKLEEISSELEHFDPVLTIRRNLHQIAKQKMYTQKLIQLIDNSLGIEISEENLVSSLRDGSILCRLANNIIPYLIPTFYEAPSDKEFLSESKCRKNIESFITACTNLGLNQIIYLHMQ